MKPGECKDIRLKISETYTGNEVFMPVRVIRGEQEGAKVFVTAAIHGDEINGVGIVQELIAGAGPELIAGTLVLVPVVNIFGFESHDRYLPDRRDLNRAFPGMDTGSLAGRFAHTIMEEVVQKCDFGIDLHSAAMQRTNFPNVRANLRNPGCRQLAELFGASLVVNGTGPAGSLRREACRAGVPTIILEAGEPWKVEPSVMAVGVRGIQNVLKGLNMMKGNPLLPKLQITSQRTMWIRAQVGGILRFHVAPGDLVEKNQPIATNYGVLGLQQNILTSPHSGIVLGMATLPTVKPGEPVCHLALPRMRFTTLRKQMEKISRTALYRQAAQDLATNIAVTQPEEMNGDEASSEAVEALG